MAKKKEKAKSVQVTLADDIKLSTTRTKNGNGYLICSSALLAKEGVLVYKDYEMPPRVLEMLDYPSEIRVFRPLSVLQDAIAEFEALPLTNGHPFEDVTVKDREPVVGMVNGARIRGKGVKGTVVIIEPGAIHDVEQNARSQLSIGFKSDLEVSSGIHGSDAYDVVIKSLVPNHVALTSAGRCGPECSIADSIACGCTSCTNRLNSSSKSKDQKMSDAIVVINDEAIPVDKEHEAKLRTAAAALKDATERASTLEGENKVLKDEKKKLEDEMSDEKMRGRVNAAAKVRGAILAKARGYLDSMDGTDALPDDEIMKKVLAKAGYENPEGDARYLQGMFDALPSNKKDAGGANGSLFAGKDAPESEPEDPAAAARKKFMEDNAKRSHA